MHERYLTAIWSEDGLAEYDINGEDSSNITTFLLPEAEFEELSKNGIFKEINAACNLLIDDYESEIVNKEALRKCEDILKRRQINRGVFAETLRSICEKGFALGLDF